MKKDPVFFILEGQCDGPSTCPLSRVKPGTTVCIKHLSTGPELTDRLRELGFCEEQKIKLVSRNSNYICQVCNARLGISEKLADAIIVETLPGNRSVPAHDSAQHPRAHSSSSSSSTEKAGRDTNAAGQELECSR